jgi:multimeric flavodoxin WrbA
MKLIGISGSSRNKHTNYMLETVLKSSGQDFETFFLKDLEVTPCNNCKSCHKTFKCVINDDMQKIYSKLNKADIIVLASPTYFDNVSGLMKNFMDRCLPYYFSMKLENKKAALLTCGGFKHLIEKNDDNECVWCKESDSCKKTVKRCLDSMENFSNHLGLAIIGSVYAIHGNPQIKKQELIELGNKI